MGGKAEDLGEGNHKPWVFRVKGKDIAIDRQVSTAVFRIFQEALTNVARHAEAQHVDVRIDVTDDDVCLEVRDDGKGITPAAAASPKSLGLAGIRHPAPRPRGSPTP